MPKGYLVGLGVTAACTVLALFPPHRPQLLVRLGSVVTPAVNELPQFFGLVLLAATVLAVVDGDPVAGVDLVWLSVTASTLAGLVVIAARGVSARAAVAQGLSGAGMDDTTDASGAQVPSGAAPGLWRWALRVLVSPVPLRPRRVERLGDIPYGTARRQSLDVYRRRDRPQGGPVLLYLHGGGYFSGSKRREARALLHHFAVRGWVCVSATYRLRPAAGFTEHLEDAEAALSWTRRHAGTYGADASMLVMAGSSAGGHLTALVALRSAAATVQAGRPPEVTAAVGLYGYYGRYHGRTAQELSPTTPMALDARNAPPFFLVHGDHDVQVPIDGARAFAVKLRAESTAPVVLAELPGGQHAFDLWRSWRLSAVLDGLDRFLADQHVLGSRAGRR